MDPPEISGWISQEYGTHVKPQGWTSFRSKDLPWVVGAASGAASDLLALL
jgi:hypothetical protein